MLFISSHIGFGMRGWGCSGNRTQDSFHPKEGSYHDQTAENINPSERAFLIIGLTPLTTLRLPLPGLEPGSYV